MGLTQKTIDIKFDEVEVLTIDYPVDGVIVFPSSEPTTFYLVNTEKVIIQLDEKTLSPSIDSERLQSGFYYLIFETPTKRTIYKIIKQ
jgi:hypothetical protein